MNASSGLGNSGHGNAKARMSEGLGRSVGIPNMDKIEEEQDDEASSNAGSLKEGAQFGGEDLTTNAEVAVSRHSINEGQVDKIY